MLLSASERGSLMLYGFGDLLRLGGIPSSSKSDFWKKGGKTSKSTDQNITSQEKC